MAARWWIGGAANQNWNENTGSVSNWSATSGGVVRVAPPTISDDVTFDGVGVTGNSNSTISAIISCLSFTVTSGYTQTITHNAVLTIAGNVTFNTSYTIAGASAITISATSTITSGGKTWPNSVTFTNANTKTLSGNWTITGTLTVSAATTLNWTTNEILTLGGLTLNAAMSGTAGITLASGTWSGASALSNNLTLSSGTTVSGSVAYNTGTLTGSGTTTTTSSTLTVATSTTFNTSGISWNNVTLTATATLTINSLLSIGGTFTINAGVTPTFAGTAGFTVATFTWSTASAVTLTFKNSVTYTITTAFNCFLSRNGSIALFTSDDGTLKATLTLNNGATCNVLASFTRIDASGGRPILSFNGTITTCTNIFSYSDVAVPPSILVRKFGRRKPIYDRAKTVLYQIP